MSRIALAAALALALTPAVAIAKPKARATCPSVSILADASRVAVLKADKVDLKAEIVTPELGCKLSGTAARASLSFMVKGAIAPEADVNLRTVPYFVAVIEGGKVVEKKVFELKLPFTGSDRKVLVKESIARVDIPISKGRTAADYSVTIGFQLTPEQVVWNRTNTGKPN